MTFHLLRHQKIQLINILHCFNFNLTWFIYNLTSLTSTVAVKDDDNVIHVKLNLVLTWRKKTLSRSRRDVGNTKMWVENSHRVSAHEKVVKNEWKNRKLREIGGERVCDNFCDKLFDFSSFWLTNRTAKWKGRKNYGNYENISLKRFPLNNNKKYANRWKIFFSGYFPSLKTAAAQKKVFNMEEFFGSCPRWERNLIHCINNNK